MEFLASWNLSLYSLLGFLALPFAYVIFHTNNLHRDATIRFINFIFTAFAILLAAIVLVKAISAGRSITLDDGLLMVAHLAPLGLIYFLIHQTQNIFQMILSMYGPPPNQDPNQARSDYAPVPLNDQVERISWNDLVIDRGLREELTSIIELLKTPSTADRYGIELPKGILLSGPPGTGKTTIAKVIANTANLAFFVLKADEVVSKWVGESEKNLSSLFKAAQQHTPAVIFIDEVDAIGKSRTGESAHQDNLLNHLLQLIDGVVRTEGLYVIAATNRPDLVDAALKRAGRLNRSIKVGLPDIHARVQLFALYLNKLTLSNDVPLQTLAKITEGKSCADIKEICNQAGLNAFKRDRHCPRDYTR